LGPLARIQLKVAGYFFLPPDGRAAFFAVVLPPLGFDFLAPLFFGVLIELILPSGKDLLLGPLCGSGEP